MTVAAHDELELVIKALEQYYAYTVADDTGYKELAERLKRKPAERVRAEVR